MQAHAQLWDIVPPQGAHGSIISTEVEEEIHHFLEAVKSYPSRAAKEPGITFQQHLSSIVALGQDRAEVDRRYARSRRH